MAITSIVLLFGAAAVATSVVLATADHTDPKTLCSVKGPSSITVVLVDATDTISPIQQQAIENRLSDVLGNLQKNELLQVFEIRPNKDLLEPSFAKCRPVSPDEVSNVNGNKRQASKRFNEEFMKKLHSTLDATLHGPSSPQSPIMEAIQAASVRALQSRDLQRQAPGFRRQLVVISDMIQNSDGLSQYHLLPDFSEFDQTPEFVHTRSDLDGVKVTVFYILRNHQEHIQNSHHVDFWTRWFNSQHAIVEDWAPLEG